MRTESQNISFIIPDIKKKLPALLSKNLLQILHFNFLIIITLIEEENKESHWKMAMRYFLGRVGAHGLLTRGRDALPADGSSVWGGGGRSGWAFAKDPIINPKQ